MAYSATYDSADTDDIVIDGLGTILVVFVSFGSLIALILLAKWFKKKSKWFRLI